MNFDHFNRTVDLILKAATTPASWPDLPRELAGGVNAHFACTVVSDANRGGAGGVAFGVSREDHEPYPRRSHRNHSGRFSPVIKQGAVDERCLIMPRAALEATELYQTSFRPFVLGVGPRLWVWRGSEGQRSISLFRPSSRDPFDADELHWIRALTPHLCRASAVERRLREAELAAGTAMADLERFPIVLTI